MAQRARERTNRRKAGGLCIYCGIQPQFWGSKCVFCRQLFAKSPLPAAAKRALHDYRREQAQALIDRIERAARAEVRKLLASKQVQGKREQAVRLYAGIDTGKWRSLKEAAEIMGVSKQYVHQLLIQSKAILSLKLSGRVPWVRPARFESD